MAHLCYYLQALDKHSPSKLLTICGDRKRSVFEVTKRVGALARGLRCIGVQKDDRVALLALSHDYCLEALMAVMAVGAIAVPLNWRWSDREIALALSAVQANCLIIDSQFLRLTGLCLHTVVLGEEELTNRPAQAHAAESLIGSNMIGGLDVTSSTGGICIICFTSGTTGAPKGVVLTHNSFHVQSMAKLLLVGYNGSDVYLHTAPLFHVGGLSSAFAALSVGTSQVFLPKFDAAEALGLIRSWTVTAFIAVPAILKDLIAESKGSSFQCVRKLLLGGGELPASLFWQARATFPSARLVGAYGMTEACSSMTFLVLDRAQLVGTHGTSPGVQGICIGQPPPGIEMDIRVSGLLKLLQQCWYEAFRLAA
jgi:o-succinylbenzoate---CoA ligase